MIKDGVEAQMVIMDRKMVQIEQVFSPYAIMPDGHMLYERVRDARFVLPPAETKETSPVAQRPPTIEFEDIPLDETRRMSRGLRIEPESYSALKQKIPSLDTTATRITIPEHTTPTTMKNRILHVAGALGMPATVRKIPGGLLFWRSTDEDPNKL